MVAAQPVDERRHVVGPSPWSGETWGFDVADAASGLAAFVQLTVHPNRRTCWFWAGVRATGRPYVLCRDLDIAAPAHPLEIRGSALWSHLICETPFEHWTVAMEAYAVALEPPYEAWGAERGERVGLAFDLEWESTGAPELDQGEAVSGYQLACEVNGELQVGHDRFAIAGFGTRHHHWGAIDPPWFGARWPASAAIDEDRAAPWLLEWKGGSLQLLRALSDGTKI